MLRVLVLIRRIKCTRDITQKNELYFYVYCIHYFFFHFLSIYFASFFPFCSIFIIVNRFSSFISIVSLLPIRYYVFVVCIFTIDWVDVGFFFFSAASFRFHQVLEIVAILVLIRCFAFCPLKISFDGKTTNQRKTHIYSIGLTMFSQDFIKTLNRWNWMQSFYFIINTFRGFEIQQIFSSFAPFWSNFNATQIEHFYWQEVFFSVRKTEKKRKKKHSKQDTNLWKREYRSHNMIWKSSTSRATFLGGRKVTSWNQLWTHILCTSLFYFLLRETNISSFQTNSMLFECGVLMGEK